MAITLTGVFGLVLALAGVTLVYKQIDAVVSLITLVALALIARFDIGVAPLAATIGR